MHNWGDRLTEHGAETIEQEADNIAASMRSAKYERLRSKIEAGQCICPCECDRLATVQPSRDLKRWYSCWPCWSDRENMRRGGTPLDGLNRHLTAIEAQRWRAFWEKRLHAVDPHASVPGGCCTNGAALDEECCISDKLHTHTHGGGSDAP